MSYKGSYLISKCELIPNGSSLEETYDITRGNPTINYYESVRSPSISMTVSFIDIDQMVSVEGITGGEMIDLEVIIPDFGEKFEIKSKKQKLVLNAVRDVVTSANKQIATLEFISEESLVNETSRVNKKFTGNVTQIVNELLTNEAGSDKKGIQTEKEFKSDQAVNKYSFIGNLKRPFETIQWLCPKAQASPKNFGFLFFENRDGYHFKSVENLLKQEPEFSYQQPSRPTETDLRIIESNLNQSNDIGINAEYSFIWISHLTNPPLHRIFSKKVLIHLINRHRLNTQVHLDVDHKIILKHLDHDDPLLQFLLCDVRHNPQVHVTPLLHVFLPLDWPVGHQRSFYHIQCVLRLISFDSPVSFI